MLPSVLKFQFGINVKHFANARHFSNSRIQHNKKSFKLVVAGGGSGGCSTAAKFARILGKDNVAVIEPLKTHYYQPMWTLVGGGKKNLEQSGRPMSSVLPKQAIHIPDKVVGFDPENNIVHTDAGTEISYEYLVVAMGIQLHYDWIKGLPEAFETPGVCSNYSSQYVLKTLPAIQQFSKGNAIFTFPNTPIKCPGAPQKIMYLAHEHLNKSGKLKDANLIFNTSLGVVFAVKKYADRLQEIMSERNIEVNHHMSLIEVNPDKKECIFEKLNSTSDPKETVSFPYEMLHVTPPMAAPDVIRNSELSDQNGYLDVDKFTLRHKKFNNIFGIGDCTNIPTSKTAAAVAAQVGILKKNLSAVIKNKPVPSTYDGYTSCPIVVGYNKCIMAEFDFDPKPLETFPVDQGKQRRSMYYMKTDIIPFIYWKLLLNGYWEGPSVFRKLMSFGTKN